MNTDPVSAGAGVGKAGTPHFTGPKGMGLSDLHSLVADGDIGGKNQAVINQLRQLVFE